MSGRIIQIHSNGQGCPAEISLDHSDSRVLSDATRTEVPEWSIETYIDPDGEVSLMIIPPNVDDAIGPTLIVHKAGLNFHLDQFRWDEYRSVGVYFDLYDMLRAMDDVLSAIPGGLSAGARTHT